MQKIINSFINVCQQSCRKRLLFIIFLAALTPALIHAQNCRTSDSLELVKLYNATGGPNWTNKWDLTKPIDTWYGIKLNTDGCVTCIDLDGGPKKCDSNDFVANGNNLVGTLPNLNLPELTHLILSSNKLTGSIPDFNLPKLYLLSLGANQFVGSVPSFSNLKELVYLALCCNQLSGKVPDFNLPNLEGLYFQNNKFTGSLPNLNLPQIRDLRFYNNQITGCFPASYKAYCNIDYYDFSNNPGLPGGGNFDGFCSSNVGICVDTSSCRYRDSLALIALYNATGGPNWTKKDNWKVPGKPIDTWYGVQTNGGDCVIELKLQNNNLTGTIPTEIGNFSRIEGIDFFDNNIAGNIPTSIANLTSLIALSLSYNALSGGIPFTIGDLTNLEYLELFGNPNLNGVIPSDIGNLTNLLVLDLWGCGLTGSIPSTIGNLTKLNTLKLFENNLSGSIPTSIGQLKNLEILYLHDNPILSGIIPASIGTIGALKEITLYATKLSGLIPSTFNNLTNLQWLYIGPPYNSNYTGANFEGWENTANINIPPSAQVRVNHNKFTFEDILPTLSLFNNLLVDRYAPQDSIYRDTIITRAAGQPLTIDLGIDATIADNQYEWYQNAQLDTTIVGSNKRIFNNLKLADAGNYHVRVKNPQAPQLTLYSRRIQLNVQQDTNNCRYRDSLELVKVYNATSGPNWTNKWDLTKPMNTWYGVQLNPNGCVICLELDGALGCSTTNVQGTGNNLVGTIPAELGNLSELSRLILSNNKLRGSIPPTLGNLQNLTELWLFNNQLTGNIPTELGNLSNLKMLSLSRNQLIGSIPISLSNLTNLEQLWLFENQLTGTIPTGLKNLNKLNALSLASNRLTGSIPNTIGSFPNLVGLWLYSNQLSGSIPDEVGNLLKLQELSLEINQFTGVIPNGISNLKALTSLWLGNNQISGNLPTWIGNLKNLKILNLASNKLSNSLPTEIGSLTNLQQIYLNKNAFSGCFPASFQTFCRLNFSADVNANGYNFTSNTGLPGAGDFSQFCSNKTGICVDTSSCRYRDSLELVKLYNATSGPNWTNKWDLTKPMNTWYGVTVDVNGCVSQVSIPNNKLIGIIPNLNLPNLSSLNLNRNQLSDTIPNFNLPRLIVLRLNNNNLSGFPLFSQLPAMGQGTQGDSLTFYQNRLTFDDIIPNLPLISRMNGKVKYAPQDSIYTDTLINRQPGQSLIIDLGIDASIASNVYKWYKNGTLWLTISGSNQLSFTNLQSSDAAIYHVQVTNPQAISLTLYSRKITLAVIPDPSSCRHQDSLTLVQFYDATGGPSTWRTKWNLSQPMNTWYGVKLNSTGCITHLDLDGTIDFTASSSASGNNLTGTLPSIIGKLSNLQVLSLAGNSLKGVISSQLTNLSNLEILDLSNNQFEGAILNTLGDLSKLIVLNLSQNKLIIIIPKELGNLSKLQRLELHANQLIGSIPKELGNLLNLLILKLDSNQLTGSIPTDLGRLQKLQILSLQYNRLSNTIPRELGNLANLTSLLLNDNNLSGCFPTQLGGFCTIDYNFSNNALLPWRGDFQRFCNDEMQVGASCDDGNPNTVNDAFAADCTCKGVPAETTCRYQDSLSLVTFYNTTGGANSWRIKWNLSQPLTTWHGLKMNAFGCVTSISLPANDIKGALPSALTELKYLDTIYLPNNQLTGNIPTQLGNLTNLTHLSLEGNQFNGSIPTELGNLTKLITLSLSNNMLANTIPTALRRLANLHYLNLSGNKLNGSVPNELNDLKRLEWLILSNNQLNGKIPNLVLPNLKVLLLANNQFTGELPKLNTPNLRRIALQKNKLIKIIDLNHIRTWNDEVDAIRYNEVIRLDSNSLTFKDIVPYVAILDAWSSKVKYAPQDSIFVDTLIFAKVGEKQTIGINVDEVVTDNQYFWYKNGQPYPALTTRELTFDPINENDAGVYYLQIKNPEAPALTLYSRSIIVEVKANEGEIYNGITPDDPDGNNRYFEIENLNQFPDTELKVYNRWGELVFLQKPYDNKWMGTDQQNSPLPQDTYYYILNLNSPDMKPLKGYILLVR